MNKPKGMPLTKEEIMLLVSLVEANAIILFSKAINASNNQLKGVTWSKISDHFNSLIVSSPRTPEQLRLKWENLKKAARKRRTKIRMNNLKTGGAKPDNIPPDEALDKVAVILGKLKRQTMVEEINMSVKKRNLAIAEYYDARRKQEEEMFVLKRMKLKLKILEQERKLEENK